MPQPHERDIAKTTADLETWFTSKVDAPVELRSLGGPESTGFSSDTLMYDAVWDSGNGPKTTALVVRFKPTGFPIFPTYDLTIQYRCMERLGPAGVPVPRMLWLEEDEAAVGSPFYVMERLDGRIPPDRPPYHMEGWLCDAPAAERARIWWAGLEAMATVHNCDWKGLGFDFLDEPARGATGMSQQLDTYRDFLDWALDGEKHPLFERGYAWLCENRPTQEPIRLVWGDARIGNQIFDDSGCIAVIDWEMATLGDPAADLAWFLFVDRHHCEGIGVPRLEGLPGRDETVARWEALTGLAARETIDYYEMWAAFRFATIMIRVGNQFKYYELLEQESDFHVNNTVSGLLAKLLDQHGA